MSDEVTIRVGVDTSDAEKSLDLLQSDVDKVTATWAVQERQIRRSLNRTIQGIRGVISVVRNTLRLMNISLDPVQEAIINAILVSMAAALTIHRVLEAATFGLSAAATVVLSTITVGISVAAIYAAAQGMAESKRNLQDAEALVSSLSSLAFMGVRF